MLCILVSAPAVEISRRLALGRAAAAAAAVGAPAAASAKAGDPLPIRASAASRSLAPGVIDAFLPSDDLASPVRAESGRCERRRAAVQRWLA